MIPFLVMLMEVAMISTGLIIASFVLLWFRVRTPDSARAIRLAARGFWFLTVFFFVAGLMASILLTSWVFTGLAFPFLAAALTTSLFYRQTFRNIGRPLFG